MMVAVVVRADAPNEGGADSSWIIKRSHPWGRQSSVARELAHELETYSQYSVIVIDGAGKTVASIGIVAD